MIKQKNLNSSKWLISKINIQKWLYRIYILRLKMSKCEHG